MRNPAWDWTTYRFGYALHLVRWYIALQDFALKCANENFAGCDESKISFYFLKVVFKTYLAQEIGVSRFIVCRTWHFWTSINLIDLSYETVHPRLKFTGEHWNREILSVWISPLKLRVRSLKGPKNQGTRQKSSTYWSCLEIFRRLIIIGINQTAAKNSLLWVKYFWKYLCAFVDFSVISMSAIDLEQTAMNCRCCSVIAYTWFGEGQCLSLSSLNVRFD